MKRGSRKEIGKEVSSSRRVKRALHLGPRPYFKKWKIQKPQRQSKVRSRKAF